MRQWILWFGTRLALRLCVLLAVLGAIFLAVDRLPGNAAQLMLGTDRTDASLAAATEKLGLDQPVWVRYGRWLGNSLRGDLGESATGRQISDILSGSLPVTLVTTGSALILTAIIATALGIWWATWKPKSVGNSSVNTLTTAFIALPEFVIGTFLITVFSLWLHLLPAVTISGSQGVSSPSMYVLPIVALVIPQVSWNTRIIRGAASDVLNMPHIEAAKIAGVDGYKLLLRHVFPLIAPTVAATLATTSGVLIAGTVAVETLFNHPGVGLVIAGAVANRDIPLLVATLTVTGACILLLLTCADAVRVAFTPKEQL